MGSSAVISSSIHNSLLMSDGPWSLRGLRFFLNGQSFTCAAAHTVVRHRVHIIRDGTWAKALIWNDLVKSATKGGSMTARRNDGAEGAFDDESHSYPVLTGAGSGRAHMTVVCREVRQSCGAVYEQEAPDRRAFPPVLDIVRSVRRSPGSAGEASSFDVGGSVPTADSSRVSRQAHERKNPDGHTGEPESLGVGLQSPRGLIPKCRRRTLSGELRKYLGDVFRQLAQQKESRIDEGHLLPDHVHMLIAIPPKYAVAQVVGFIKGRARFI